MNKLKRPTSALVEEYLSKFDDDYRYSASDKVIDSLLSAYPKNEKLEDVLVKVTVINDLYGTNIFGTFKMAQHILSLGIDEKLKAGDLDLVNKIATGHGMKAKSGEDINFYSFATKYCNWHNKDKYPIYDSFVDKLLAGYMKEDRFTSFKRSELRDIYKFKKVLADFIDHYGLYGFKLKQIDKFLWIYGKEVFNKERSI